MSSAMLSQGRKSKSTLRFCVLLRRSRPDRLRSRFRTRKDTRALDVMPQGCRRHPPTATLQRLPYSAIPYPAHYPARYLCSPLRPLDVPSTPARIRRLHARQHTAKTLASTSTNAPTYYYTTRWSPSEHGPVVLDRLRYARHARVLQREKHVPTCSDLVATRIFYTQTIPHEAIGPFPGCAPRLGEPPAFSSRCRLSFASRIVNLHLSFIVCPMTTCLCAPAYLLLPTPMSYSLSPYPVPLRNQPGSCATAMKLAIVSVRQGRAARICATLYVICIEILR